MGPVEWRKAARYYGRLLMGTPGHVWRAADAMGRLGLLIGLLLAVFLGVHGDIPTLWLAIAAGTLVMGALLKANYDRYALLEKDRDQWRKMIHDDMDKTFKRLGHDIAWDALMASVNEGRDGLWKPLWQDQSGTESDWVAKVDAWEVATIRQLGEHWPSEVEVFRTDTGLLDDMAAWRERLSTRMDIKLGRLMDIAKRETGTSDA